MLYQNTIRKGARGGSETAKRGFSSLLNQKAIRTGHWKGWEPKGNFYFQYKCNKKGILEEEGKSRDTFRPCTLI